MIGSIVRTGLLLGLLTCLAWLYTERYGGPLLPAFQWLDEALPYHSWTGLFTGLTT